MPLLRGEAVLGGVAPTQGAYQEWPWSMTLVLRLDPAGPCGGVGCNSPGRSVGRPRGNIRADSICTVYSFA